MAQLDSGKTINTEIWKSDLMTIKMLEPVFSKLFGKEKGKIIAQQIQIQGTSQEIIEDLDKGVDESDIIDDIKYSGVPNEVSLLNKIISITLELFKERKYKININYKDYYTKNNNESKFNQEIINIIKKYHNINKIKKEIDKLYFLGIRRNHFIYYHDNEKEKILNDIFGNEYDKIKNEILNKYGWWECRNCTFQIKPITIGGNDVLPSSTSICRLCGVINKYEEKKIGKKKEKFCELSKYVIFRKKKLF